jgi:hypothetical protein
MNNNVEIFKWTIYKITNPVGSIYIGKTRNLDNRIRQYKYPAHHGHHLASASVKKYGFNNHQFEVIDQFESDKNFAAGKELFWIRTYMSNRNKWPEMNGLNLTDGGDGNLGRPATKKQKELLSIRMKGHKYNLGRGKQIIEITANNDFIKCYPTISDAVREVGIGMISIRKVLQGKQKSTKGRFFVYKENFNNVGIPN